MAKIKGITIEIGANTSKFNSAITDLNKSLKSTNYNLRDVNKLLKLDPSNVELLRKKQKYLTEAISDTKKKLDNEKEALKQLKDADRTPEVRKQMEALELQIAEDEQQLEGFEKELKDFGSVGKQQAKLVSQKFKDVGSSIKDAGEKIKGVGTKMTTYVTAPILGGMTAAVKVTSDFDTSMSQVSAVSGATGKDFDDLREKAREMGAKTKFSASEAADAMNYMAMAGWKTSDMLDGIEGIMNLAAASGEDLATTSDIVTDALTAFGLKAENSSHFADILAAASSNANTNVAMLGESFKYAAPVAGSLGITAEDTSIALGLMANAGIKASQGGTALRTGLSNLVKPTKQMRGYMDKYNIALQTNEDGSVNLRKTMGHLRERMGALSQEEQAAAASAIFGKNAMAGWLSIINASDEDFNKLTDAIDNCDGTSQSMAETMQDNLGGQLTILKSQLSELAISIGDTLMPTIRQVIETIQGWIDKFNALDDSQKETVVKIALVVAAIGPLITILGTLTIAIGAIVGAIGSLTLPITAVIAVITGLIAAGVWLYKNWDTVKKKAGELKEKVVTAWNNLKQDVGDAVDTLKQKVSTQWETLKTNVTNAATTVWSKVSGAWDSIKTKSSQTWETISTTVSTKWQSIKTTIGSKVASIASDIGGKFTSIKTDIATKLTNVWTTVGRIFGNIKQTIQDKIEAAKNFVSDTIEKIKGFFHFEWSLPHLKLPHIVVDKYIDVPVLGKIPDPTSIHVDWYKKAYQNPYLFTSPTVINGKGFGDGNGSGELVYGRDALLRDIAQASGGDEITINVYAPEGMNINQLADQIQRRLVQVQNQKVRAYA